MVKLPDPQKCKQCGGKGRVINTRTDPNGYRWRRRECKDCHWRWFSYETIIDPRTQRENKYQHVVSEPLPEH